MNKGENIKIEDGFKPRTWLLIVLIIIGLGITIILANKVIEDRQNSESIFDRFSALFNNTIDQYDDFDKEFEETDKEIKLAQFNTPFEHYAGTESGFFIPDLLDKVITNNKTKKDHTITINYNNISTQDEEQIRSFKSSFNNNQNYEVILDYDDNGYVNSITIR